MTGLEIIKAPGSTASEIADIISNPCPPTIPETCDRLSCRECWLGWLMTGEPPKEKGPSEERTTPDEEGLHPDFVRFLRQHKHLLKLLEAIKEDVNSDVPGRTSQ